MHLVNIEAPLKLDQEEITFNMIVRVFEKAE